jgi:hypothetical protein
VSRGDLKREGRREREREPGREQRRTGAGETDQMVEGVGGYMDEGPKELVG